MIKKFTFILFSICVYLVGKAQVGHPFPTDSASWYDFTSQSEWESFMPSIQSDRKYFYNGYDTINGKVYSKIFITKTSWCVQMNWQWPCGNNWTHTDSTDSGYRLRTDSNKVYLKYGTNNEFILYDYNLIEGDTFTVYREQDTLHFQCVLIDSVLTNTGYRKQWNFEWVEVISGCEFKWIEGATSNHGLFYNEWVYICNTLEMSNYTNTNCFVDHEILVLGEDLASCENLVSSVSETENLQF